MKRRRLCRLGEIPEGGAKGFAAFNSGSARLFAVRSGSGIFVYRNTCPHAGTPLDIMQDRFLSADGRRIVCATHGAEFTIATGECVAGLCFGETLEAVDAIIEEGAVLIAEDGDA